MLNILLGVPIVGIAAWQLVDAWAGIGIGAGFSALAIGAWLILWQPANKPA